MHNNSVVSKAVRFALIAGATTAAWSAPVAFAADGDEVERIEVTGSRIRQTDIEGANPVTVVSRAEMEKMGITDVGDLIQKLPAMSGSPLATTVNNGGSGAVTVNLRGMGSIRTLVLINGRRTVDGGDFQTIPSNMIERIEILKDGASAIYGADAVAGVVNVITRRDFEGVEASFNYSDYMDTDNGIQKSFSLVTGKVFDGGNVVFGAEITEQEAILQGDTDVLHFNAPYVLTEINDELCFLCTGENYWADTKTLLPGEGGNAVLLGSSRVPNGNFRFNKNSAWFPSGSAIWDGIGDPNDPNSYRAYNGSVFDPNNDTYNYAPVNFLQTPYLKKNAFVEANFDVAENVEFFSALRVSQRESRQRLAAVPYDTQTDPGYLVPVLDADGNPVLDEGQPVFQNGISKDNIYNPFGEDVIRIGRRMLEGDREFSQDVLQFQGVAGFRGIIADAWEWDVSYNYGYRSRTDTDFGQFSGAALANALGPSFYDANGNAVCGTPEAPIDGCVPLNLFGGEGTVTDEMLDYVGVTLVDTVRSQQDIFNANLTNSELFELPGGFVGASIGYEYRREELVNDVDSGKAGDTVTGNTGSGVAGAYHVNSLYAEAIVPVLSGVIAAELLELKVGARYDDFSSFGGETTFLAGLKWQPFQDLLLRGTYSEVFRAPTVGELYSGQADSFVQATDPCSTDNFGKLSPEGQAQCVADGVPQGGAIVADTQLPARVGGNPDLQPETGDNITVGLAYSPSYIEGLNLTLDWWKIELDDVIDSLSAGNILDLCYEDLNQAQCANIDRKVDGTVRQIQATNQNLASRTAEGIDTEITYSYDFGQIGELSAFVGWTHLLTREDVDYEGADVTDLKGWYSWQLDETFAEDKVNFSLDWSWQDLTVSYGLEYISAIQAETYLFESDYIQDIDSQMYHDISVAYEFAFGTRVSAGVTNFTDEEAPFIDSGFNASTDPVTYRMFGRGYFVRLTHKF